jgi:hypothetical protein
MHEIKITPTSQSLCSKIHNARKLCQKYELKIFAQTLLQRNTPFFHS